MGGRGSFLPWGLQRQSRAGLPPPTPYGQPALPNPAALVAGYQSLGDTPTPPQMPSVPGWPGYRQPLQPGQEVDRVDWPDRELERPGLRDREAFFGY